MRGGTVLGGPRELIRRFYTQGADVLDFRTKHENPRQDLGRKARVLAVVHGWPPYFVAGSERMMQHLLSALPADEFDVSVLSFGYNDERPIREPYRVDGIRVDTGYVPLEVPDVIVTHHGQGSRVTQDICQDYPEIRVVAVYHNERYDIPDIQALDAELDVYNTHWVAERLKKPGIVVHPPLEPERHIVPETGSNVTLVNLQKNKGVDTFNAMASRFPGTPFLGVKGGYGKQEPSPGVRVMDTTQDMREVWKDTRILLAPSEYESYGMVAAEACLNGIPVLAHPTPGLVECLDESGLFLDRSDYDKWESTIRLLLTDRDAYEERSEMARIRGQELLAQTVTELELFVESIRGLV